MIALVRTPDLGESSGMARSASNSLDILPFAIGAVGLGATGLYFRNFALQWQPVPPGLDHRAILVIVSGGVLVAGGALALRKATATIGAALLAAWYGLWVLALHLPAVVAKPGIASLLGLCEILALAAAATLLCLPRTATAARIAFGFCAIVFGLSHIAHPKFTAGMVPEWIPGSLLWAYATGIAHLAAGLALVSGMRAHLAASLLALMCGGFVLLLHLPRVMAAPHDQAEWTMLFVALSICGAAWLMRGAKA